MIFFAVRLNKLYFPNKAKIFKRGLSRSPIDKTSRKSSDRSLRLNCPHRAAWAAQTSKRTIGLWANNFHSKASIQLQPSRHGPWHGAEALIGSDCAVATIAAKSNSC